MPVEYEFDHEDEHIESKTIDDSINPVPENEVQILSNFVIPRGKTSKLKKIVLEGEKGKKIHEEPTKYSERLLTDIATGNLTLLDQEIILTGDILSQRLQTYGESYKLDLSPSHNYVVNLFLQVANVSKGHNFGLLKGITNRSQEVVNRTEITRKMDTPKKGIFG